DHAMAEGLTVSPYYDPMMAKLIAHGATREEARRRLVSGLQDLVVLGIETNRRFLIDCLSHPEFVRARTSTAFIEQHLPASARARPPMPSRMKALAAALLTEAAGGERGALTNNWHSSGVSATPLLLASNGTSSPVIVRALGGQRFVIEVDGQTHDVALLKREGARLRFRADGLEETAHLAWERGLLHLDLAAVTASFEDLALAGRRMEAGAGGGAAVAPMTGTVIEVRVKPGDKVVRGQCVVVLEAMKMQHEIGAPGEGVVSAVLVKAGEQVTTRKLLVEITT
ncbi:MAG TPA: biotin/lipoyl-containing protein, partial [Stellaceae bacterium]|nr:biotin/lipoyl-containing protein [Stellaceae bacterium]